MLFTILYCLLVLSDARDLQLRMKLAVYVVELRYRLRLLGYFRTLDPNFMNLDGVGIFPYLGRFCDPLRPFVVFFEALPRFLCVRDELNVATREFPRRNDAVCGILLVFASCHFVNGSITARAYKSSLLLINDRNYDLSILPTLLLIGCQFLCLR